MRSILISRPRLDRCFRAPTFDCLRVSLCTESPGGGRQRREWGGPKAEGAVAAEAKSYMGRKAKNKQRKFFPQNLSPPSLMGRAGPYFKMEKVNKAKGPFNKIGTPQDSPFVFPGIVKSGVEDAKMSLDCYQRFHQHLPGPPDSRRVSRHVHRSPPKASSAG